MASLRRIGAKQHVILVKMKVCLVGAVCQWWQAFAFEQRVEQVKSLGVKAGHTQPQASSCFVIGIFKKNAEQFGVPPCNQAVENFGRIFDCEQVFLADKSQNPEIAGAYIATLQQSSVTVIEADFIVAGE